ncbi:MAG TPA: prephenate dehydrogenase/arogenate dehydrogenase family protein, partial [Burkholderiaceae bacterium]|nr:prephenate dehydrogenase/arogenate dehydrogenase family protein [Burkholderiaceae bacterium]
MFNKIAIFGVGLIGGSFALALKQAGAVAHVTGMGRSAASLLRARELGILDSIGHSAAEAVEGADLVLIAAPVAQTEFILDSIAPHLRPGTIVTDAGSTKTDVVAAARKALGQKIAWFVPGHPIAGRESNGPEAAIPDL